MTAADSNGPQERSPAELRPTTADDRSLAARGEAAALDVEAILAELRASIPGPPAAAVPDENGRESEGSSPDEPLLSDEAPVAPPVAFGLPFPWWQPLGSAEARGDWLAEAARAGPALDLDGELESHTPVVGRAWTELRRAIDRRLRLYLAAMARGQQRYNELIVETLRALDSDVQLLEQRVVDVRAALNATADVVNQTRQDVYETRQALREVRQQLRRALGADDADSLQANLTKLDAEVAAIEVELRPVGRVRLQVQAIEAQLERLGARLTALAGEEA